MSKVFEKNLQEFTKQVQSGWPEILKNGAFVFDIDETLLPPDAGLKQHTKLSDDLIVLLKQGLRICLISGGPGAMVERRLIRTLRAGCKKNPEALQRLTVYANGGSSLFEISAEGKYEELETYGKSNQIPRQHLEEVRNCLEEYIHGKWGLEDGPFYEVVDNLVMKRDEQWTKLPIAFKNVWADESHIAYFEDREMAEAKSGEGGLKTTSFPFINIRSPIYDENDDLVSVAGFTPTGFYSFEEQPFDLRGWIMDRLEKDLGPVAGQLVMRRAGRSSIDFTKYGADKSASLKHYIRVKHLKGDHVFYFGDEYYPGGNDEPISQDKELARQNLSILSLSQNAPTDEGRALWIGNGPETLQSFLHTLVMESA